MGPAEKGERDFSQTGKTCHCLPAEHDRTCPHERRSKVRVTFSSLLLYVHRDRRDYYGRDALVVHLHFHAAAADYEL